MWPGEGKPIVGIHGLTASHVNFIGIAERLAGRHSLFAPDLRGRGNSDKPSGPYGLKQHARDVAAAIRSQGLGRSVIVGHSMGAYVATALAADFPELVSGLVLIDGGYVLDPPPGVELTQLLDVLLAPMVERLRMLFVDRQSYRGFWRKLPTFTEEEWSRWVEAYVDYDLGGASPRLQPKANEAGVRVDFVEMARRGDVEERLRRVRVPILLIRAEHGVARGQPPVVPDGVVEAIRRCAPQLEDRRLLGTTHYTIALCEPGATQAADLIDDFAKRLDR